MTRERLEPQSNNEAGRDVSKFPHVEVEMKWKDRWVNDKLYKAYDDSERPKYYVLDMYPYPSGAGLHVGHVEGYTATDIVARYKRMQGFEVIHPMGWDAFGLPTENYAIQTGINPHKVTFDNVNAFRKQCIRTGLSIDWDREIDTSKEEYYKWTQKIFLDLYKNGLAYKAEAPVNWCTGCKTAIANEQVQQGCCERCDSEVESKNIEQWFFKITGYADRLLKDLNGLTGWPNSTRERQKNWIGRAEGIEIQIDFEMTEGNLTIFTTEPESLERSSYITIASEHPDLDRVVVESQKRQVSEYISRMIPQTELQRKKQKKNKGVFTGNYALNPLSGEKMEIWVSDSVLMNEYGGVKIELSEETQREETLFEDKEMVLARLGEKARPVVKYNLRDWLISRERYWGAPIPIIRCDSCGDQPVPESQLPVLLPEMEDFAPTGVPPLARSKEFLHTTCPNCGKGAKREAKTLDTFVDSAWYYMRFTDPHNDINLASKDLLNKWLPVDYYLGGADHATGHLLYARFLTKVLHDLGQIDFDEPFTNLVHPGIVMGEDGKKMSKRWGNAISPDVISDEYGSDALRVHEMFLGPLDQSKTWNSKEIIGSRRFIDRVWQLQQKVREEEISHEETLTTNMLIKQATNAIESGKFNIAVSEFMKYINFIDKSGRVGRKSYETFLRLLAPFAPFITEELWERAGNQYSIHQSLWPQPISQEGTDRAISLLVMINGKVRGKISQVEGTEYTEEEIIDLLKADPKLADEFKNIMIKRIIYKQGQVVNILT